MRGLLPERGLLKTRGNRHRETVDVGEVGQQGDASRGVGIGDWGLGTNVLQRVRSSSAKCIGKMSTMDTKTSEE